MSTLAIVIDVNLYCDHGTGLDDAGRARAMQSIRGLCDAAAMHAVEQIAAKATVDTMPEIVTATARVDDTNPTRVVVALRHSGPDGSEVSADRVRRVRAQRDAIRQAIDDRLAASRWGAYVAIRYPRHERNLGADMLAGMGM